MNQSARKTSGLLTMKGARRYRRDGSMTAARAYSKEYLSCGVWESVKKSVRAKVQAEKN